MPKLLLHRGHMYLGNAKSGTTSVKKQFDLIRDDTSLEIENPNDFSQQYLDSIKEHCRTLPKFVLFFHVREPWERFLSAVATDHSRSTNGQSLLDRCIEIRDKYSLVLPNDPDSVARAGLALNFVPLLETVYKVILLTLPPMADNIERLEIWNYNFLKMSLEQKWQCDFTALENTTPVLAKNTVSEFFNGERQFKAAWYEKNKKDFELYDMVSQQPMRSLTTREYISKFYEKL